MLIKLDLCEDLFNLIFCVRFIGHLKMSYKLCHMAGYIIAYILAYSGTRAQKQVIWQ